MDTRGIYRHLFLFCHLFTVICISYVIFHFSRVSLSGLFFCFDYLGEVYLVITARFLGGDQIVLTCDNKLINSPVDQSVTTNSTAKQSDQTHMSASATRTRPRNDCILSSRCERSMVLQDFGGEQDAHSMSPLSTHPPLPPSPRPPTLACKPTPLTSNRARHTGDASGSTVTDTDTVRISRTVPKIMNTRRDIFSRCG